jgi:chemotaxis protein CheD
VNAALRSSAGAGGRADDEPPPRPLGASGSTYVHPGQAVVSRGPGVLATILGSCVTVCLHDPQRGLGGMNHFLLPTVGAEAGQPGRYGPTAIDELVHLMLAWGASRDHMVAQLYGGANVLSAFASIDHLGLRNVAVARRSLAEHRVRVVAADVGGTKGRKVILDPHSGVVRVQVIGR